jgi:uncharacterized protein (TIGR02217 family)
VSNLVFPALPGLAFDVIKRPMWNTRVQSAVSGKEKRVAMMTFPLWQFELKFDFLRSDAVNLEWQKLLGLYLQVQGAFDTWLFTDPDDSAVAVQPFGAGDGATTQFQLVRTFGAGGFGFVEPIQNINGAPSIFVNGVLKATPADYSISSTGVVTFVSAPAVAAALTWTGNFYYRCRFLDDEYDFSKFAFQFWALDRIAFQSVKL